VIVERTLQQRSQFQDIDLAVMQAECIEISVVDDAVLNGLRPLAPLAAREQPQLAFPLGRPSMPVRFFNRWWSARAEAVVPAGDEPVRARPAARSPRLALTLRCTTNRVCPSQSCATTRPPPT